VMHIGIKERLNCLNMIPIYGEQSALVTEANAHFMNLCTKTSQKKTTGVGSLLLFNYDFSLQYAKTVSISLV
jgi:hypothetical protein